MKTMTKDQVLVRQFMFRRKRVMWEYFHEARRYGDHVAAMRGTSCLRKLSTVERIEEAGAAILRRK